jgi:Holliday junction resolvase RusA-like endonuclease
MLAELDCEEGVTDTLVLVLPEPPSANRWWRSGRGRMHLSHEAVAYKADAFQRAGVNGVPLYPDGEISVRVVWHRDRKAGDLDKRLGILLDALQSIKKRVKAPTPKKPKATRLVVLAPGVYDNDSQVVQIVAARVDAHPTIPKGHVRVEVGPAT